MKQYPSITKDIFSDINIYAFDKLDGSNIRAEWTKKNGFSKFGSRHLLLDSSHPMLGEAIPLIKSSYEDSLSNIFIKNKYEKVTCFFEFYGKSSFAGNHEKEEHKVTLFDIDIYKKGLLEPGEFIKLFDSVEIANLLYYGKCNSTFIESVKESKLNQMTFEGVVCKSFKRKIPIFFKVKSKAWIAKLKNYCNNNEDMFNKLL